MSGSSRHAGGIGSELLTEYEKILSLTDKPSRQETQPQFRQSLQFPPV
jgi:hypothetical protein